MPRVTRAQSKARKPTIQQSPPTPDAIMHRARSVVAELVALGREPDDIVFMVRQQADFANIPAASIQRMRTAAQAAFEQGTADSLRVKRAKQERRIQSLISRARQKGALSAEVQAEKLYAELNGTLAPREITITADAATKEALATVLSFLPADVLSRLAHGEPVSLGHVGPNGQPAITIETASQE